MSSEYENFCRARQAEDDYVRWRSQLQETSMYQAEILAYQQGLRIDHYGRVLAPSSNRHCKQEDVSRL